MFCPYISRECIHVRRGLTLCPLGIQKSNCGSALVEHARTCHQHPPWRTTSRLSSSIPEIAEKPQLAYSILEILNSLQSKSQPTGLSPKCNIILL